MHLHNLARQRQADPTAPLLGGKERNEDLFQCFGNDARPIVSHFNVGGGFIVAPPHFNASVSLAGQRLTRILDQIDQYLFNHLLVCLNGEVFRLASMVEYNARIAEIRFHELGHLVEQLFHPNTSHHRLRKRGILAVCINKADKPLATSFNGGQSFAQIVRAFERNFVVTIGSL